MTMSAAHFFKSNKNCSFLTPSNFIKGKSLSCIEYKIKGVCQFMNYMSIVFAVVYLLLFLFVCYKMFKTSRVPSNRYTPFDDLMNGIKTDCKQEKRIQDTKHETEYEEKTHNLP